MEKVKIVGHANQQAKPFVRIHIEDEPPKRWTIAVMALSIAAIVVCIFGILRGVMSW